MFLKKIKHHWQHLRVKQDEAFMICDNTTALAVLKNPSYIDMFWQEYELIPITDKVDLKAKLFSLDFWYGGQARFYGKQSGLSCEFTLACGLDVGKWKNSAGKVINIQDQPDKVLLRGPYYAKELMKKKSS